MKKAIITAASVTGIMAGIIIVRIILSINLSDLVAEVFSNVSIAILFYYCIVRAIRSRKNTIETKHKLEQAG